MWNENLNQTIKDQAFAMLIDNELPRLRAVAYRFLGNAHDADEVIQNALLKAWKKFSNFKNESKLSSWVYRIVINECHEIVRKRNVEDKHLKRYAENQHNVGNATPATLPVQLAQLRRAIASLPKLYREAITVGFLSDLSTEEAAQRLGCSPNTLYQRIYKAKALLKTQLERA